ncbi:Zinc finger C2H2-type protein [Lasiodiplodia theobromae]|uniref:Zinc finger protein draculin n=1 Tax=Lasiodiplodia theobromae TaxID=45133 RepID=A0A5N5DMX6_9PEZI|nr:Zinc finger C2H2-type protein [Lasiodiplodia theobromae]KAB2579087.1 Zinc finger protein draculin [Lasiodiplodia theobromae]KAF4537220.1 Zinc finger C2H2-type protein [Lasiodiplodia theobromae]KAF9639820.1 Zinc finger C2H2-type protein [Lasiodiplodia theobromae]
MSSFNPDEPAWYKCSHCTDQFKREDHLRRHELSHGFPRFLCEHPACGMRFHRKDVLQRHKLVHQPNPLKRRRKPRRGPIPHGPIQQASHQDSTTPPADLSPPPVALNQLPLSAALTPPRHHAASTASQSPPQDLPQSAHDSFNLTTEWDYGIHEWPEFALPAGPHNFVPSWQNCVMPVFDSTTSPLIPPSLALAHAPNASFAMDAAAFLPPPALPLSPQDMLICVDKFRQRFLPRIPFLHYSTCENECIAQNSALYYTMAMAGSLYLDEYRSKAARMHKLASETLHKQSQMRLQDFQAKILIIDFAVWYGNEEMRRWASREKHALAQALIEFVSAALPPLGYDDWARWRLREEIKRTAFAFFVNCVMQSTFYGHDTPSIASSIELSLPSPESIWEATSEAEWQAQIELLGLREKSEIIFPIAAHAILSQDTEYSTDYELATLFGQFILLCVIMDSYNAAARLPTNYVTVEGWQNRDMALFRLRDTIDGALSLWTELWWASPECLWDSNVPAHPRIENIFLHLYITTKLHKNEDSNRDRPAWTYRPIECATSMFTSVSKAGFTEVATYAAHILSFSCYYIAVEMARTMSAWLKMVAAPSYGALTRRDSEIVTRLRQCVRRFVAHPPTAPVTKQENLLGAAPVTAPKLLRDGSSLEEVIKQVDEIWTLGLGGEQWKEDEVKGVAVRPLQSTPMPNLETPMPIT